jgi:peptide/nickel transport system substrate-binding protein
MTKTHSSIGLLSRRDATKLISKGVAVGALGGALAMGHPLAARAADQKTLILAVEGDPSRLDPHTNSLWLTYRVVYHMFESFVGQDLAVAAAERAPIVPALAERWDISDDKKVYTFHLRQGVKFHDGTPWNAAAAKFNFDRLLDKSFKHYFPLAADINTWWLQDVASYRAVDDATFEVIMKQPSSEFLQRLTQGGYGSAGMVSPAAVEQYGNEDVTNYPVGTGPFKFVERVFGERIVLAKNAEYWNAKRVPKVDTLIFRPIVDVAARELALQSGQVDIIATPSPDSTDFLASQGFNVVMGPVPTIYLIWLNMKEPVLQDVRVRRAMSMAIDRAGLCEHLRRKQCIPAYSILNIGGPGYDPTFDPYPYDPEGARKLLAEAGYPDGFEIRMDWTPGGAGDVNTLADAEWLQRNWADIGIKAKIEVFDVGTYFDMMLKGMRAGTHVMEISWGESAFHWLDAVISPNAISPKGYNSGYYDNPKIGELLAKARQATTEDEQVDSLRQIQAIIGEEVPWIPFHSPFAVYAMNPKVTGFVLAPQHWHDMAIVDKTA